MGSDNSQSSLRNAYNGFGTSELVVSFIGGFLCSASLMITSYLISQWKHDQEDITGSTVDEECLTFMQEATNGKQKNRARALEDLWKQAATEEQTLLKREQLSRNTSFFGEDCQQILETSYVVVVGLGGVGSHAAHLLARCGIRKLRIIDFDQVSLSSLNRHAVAVRKDVGTPKAVCLEKYINQFAPWCEVESKVEMFTADKAMQLILGDENEAPDYVLDCIDDIRTKIALLHFCCEHDLRVLTSCGAGAKADPTRLHVSTLADVIVDPLAARIKLDLRTRFKDTGCEAKDTAPTPQDRNEDPVDAEDDKQLYDKIRNIEAVYSSEKPRMKLLPPDSDAQKSDPAGYGTVENFRIRIMPVLGTMPAIFGMAMAARVVTNLANKPFLSTTLPAMTLATSERIRRRFCLRLAAAFNKREPARGKLAYNFKMLHCEDVEFLVIQYKRRCVITFEKWQRNKIELALWNYKKNMTLDNVVLVRKDLAEMLDDLVVSGEEPTPEVLGISTDHFSAIEQKLSLLGEFDPKARGPSSILH